MFPFHFCIFAFGLCLIFCNSISNVFCDGSVCSEAPYPAEIFSSMAKMQEHLRETRVAMRKVLPGLKSKVQEQKTRLETIKGYVKHLSELSGEEIRQPNFTVHHPLNAYRFIRNHSIIHNETATKLVSEIKLYEKEKVEILKMLNELPKLADTDYEGAIHPYQGHAWLTQAAGKCLAEGNITTTVTRINIVAAKAASLVNQPEAAVFYYNEVVKIREYVKNTTFIKRVEAFTGLNSRSYEQYQSSEDSFTSDQRIATFMVYLSDVQAGGATVFPNAGISLFPNKGSAVFWYNLFNNGTEHPDTLHAACPVLLGSKWVGNLWIRRHGQEFTKPCDLDRYHSDWS
ncbi:P4HA1-like protein [Mya arenaria]|uniref:P4HA1-like protein n=1 Tax=Mya arenaria TaxID=6604 RepID=A0ABY7FCD9_MYAAR|nr:P4HA1-like protein [Mya arenaria]